MKKFRFAVVTLLLALFLPLTASADVIPEKNAYVNLGSISRTSVSPQSELRAKAPPTATASPTPAPNKANAPSRMLYLGAALVIVVALAAPALRRFLKR